MDALNVPAFHDYAYAAAQTPLRAVARRSLRRLDTRWPTQCQSFAAFIRGERVSELHVDDGLCLVLRYLASPLRYEPLNAYLVHRAVASTRSLFPMQFLIATAAGLYIYHAEHHALEARAPAAPLPALPDGCDWALIGVGRYWALAGKYAEFSPYLVTLEAGMLQAQLGHLVRLAGWHGQTLNLEGPAWRDALNLGPLETAMVGWSGSGGLPVFAPDAPTHVAEWAPNPALCDLYPQLIPLVRLFDPLDCGPDVDANPSAACRSEPQVIGNPGSRDVLDVFRARSSGNDAGGFSPVVQSTDAAFLRCLIGQSRALGRLREALPGEAQLKLSVAWISPYDANPGLYDEDLHPLCGQDDARGFLRTLEASLPHELFRYNTSALAFVFVIAVDLPEAAQSHGEHALRRLHLAAGALAQDISIVLSAHGMFARPVRMLDETALTTAWHMRSHIVYQVLAGFNRSSNWFMDLL
ncbi:MAG: hypothetical protein ACK50G_03135 [bacterium]|jgi:hypothetical protein